MRLVVFFAGLVSLTAASPVVQPIDFSAVNAAPSPVVTGPAITAAAETVTYSASASGSAAATAVATASATASVLNSRNITRRGFTFCLFGFIGNGCSSSSGSSKPATSTSVTTTATSTSNTYTQTSTSSPTITSTSTTSSACSNTWTNPNPLVTATDCPAPYEVGTYCGFVSPVNPCAIQPDGYGPKVIPDTTDAFVAYAPFQAMALNAKTPAGYQQTFKNLKAATSANTYLGLQTLHTYDVLGCSQFCSNKTDAVCTSFNIYVERDPSVNPSNEYCCGNPSSITNYKCTLWGSTIDNTTATNSGQYRDGFQVVIAASNGYIKSDNPQPPTPPGWKNPQSCSGAHSHPSTCIGQHFFPGPFDPNVCAAYATSQNALNGATSASSSLYNPKHCNFFNSYMLKRNGKPLGTYCSLFAQQYSSSAATYNPGWAGSDFWEVENSWSFSLK